MPPSVRAVIDSAAIAASPKTPWHLWVVGVLALLWFAAGAYTFYLAQQGRLPNIDPAEAAYYANLRIWQIVLLGVNTMSGAAAAVLLLLRSKLSAWLFAVSVLGVIVMNAAELITGDSRMLVDRGALIATMVIFAIVVLLVVYAARMRKRGVLR